MYAHDSFVAWCGITDQDEVITETIENERKPYKATMTCTGCGQKWTRIIQTGDKK